MIGLRGKITLIVDLTLEQVPTAGDAVEAIAKLGDRLVMVLDPAAFATATV